MDLYLVLVVDIAQSVIAGDGVTAAGKLILVDVLLADVDWLLAVELFRHDEELLFGCLLFLLLSDEGHILAPARIVGILVLTVELVNIFLS